MKGQPWPTSSAEWPLLDNWHICRYEACRRQILNTYPLCDTDGHTEDTNRLGPLNSLVWDYQLPFASAIQPTITATHPQY